MTVQLVPVLVARADRVGWADVTGHVRGTQAILRALAAIVHPRTGTGRTTVHQIAVRAGYRERWTREQLYALEAEGLIVWHRGHVVDGRRVPSTITVIKSAVIALTARARAVRDRLEADRNAREDWRLRRRTLRNRSGARWTRSRRSPLVAVAAYPPPTGDTQAGPAGGRPWESEQYCDPHGGVVGRCPSCKRSSMTGAGSAGAEDDMIGAPYARIIGSP